MDLGEVGRRSDGGTFSNSSFGRAFEEGSLSLPAPSPLPGATTLSLPNVMVGDEAFPLKMYLLRPYPGRNLAGKPYYTVLLISLLIIVCNLLYLMINNQLLGIQLAMYYYMLHNYIYFRE